jgi:hypothetical protein
MTPEAQRLAIAEACGWTCDKSGGWSKWTYPTLPTSNTSSGLPDYLNDLNAMHEAEKVLLTKLIPDMDGPSASKPSYERILHDIVCVDKPSHWSRLTTCATAAQRAEAFLRTLKLWHETR